MYENPITKIYGEIQNEIIKQDEEHLMYSVNQSVGYRVDKDELIKALRYDREQYRKGYLDCKIDMVNKIKEAREEIENNKNTTSMIDSAEFYNNGLDTALAILDKLIESEGKE